MITRIPVRPRHVEEAAEALWDRTREMEGRVPWAEAASWAREPYEIQALVVLETALPLDNEILKAWLVDIQHAIDLI